MRSSSCSPLHLDLEGGLAAGDGEAVAVEDDAGFGLPATAAGCLAEDAASAEGVRVELAV